MRKHLHLSPRLTRACRSFYSFICKAADLLLFLPVWPLLCHYWSLLICMQVTRRWSDTKPLTLISISKTWPACRCHEDTKDSEAYCAIRPHLGKVSSYTGSPASGFIAHSDMNYRFIKILWPTHLNSAAVGCLIKDVWGEWKLSLLPIIKITLSSSGTVSFSLLNKKARFLPWNICKIYLLCELSLNSPYQTQITCTILIWTLGGAWG